MPKTGSHFAKPASQEGALVLQGMQIKATSTTFIHVSVCKKKTQDIVYLIAEMTRRMANFTLNKGVASENGRSGLVRAYPLAPVFRQRSASPREVC